MTASRISCGSLTCSQQQRKSSSSLQCNAGPPCIQASGGIPSTPAALPHFICFMALVVSSKEGGLSISAFTGC